MDTVAALGASTLFQGLEAVQLKELALISESRNYTKGELIFSEGDPGTGFYLVVTGRVKVFKLSLEGKEQILHLIGPGEPLGEVPVFIGSSFPAHAEAMAESRLLFFPRKRLLQLYRTDPSLAMNMLAVLSRRLRQFTTMIEDLSLKEIPQRLAAYLVHLASVDPGREVLELDITKGMLANILGTSQETLSRVLGRMSDQGLIEVMGRRIRVVDAQELEELSQGERRL